MPFRFFRAIIDVQRGDRSRARKVFEESADLQREHGNIAFLAYPLRRLGYLALEQNDIPAARQHLVESLNYNRAAGDMPGTIASLTSIAVLALHLGKPIVAGRLYGAVEHRLEQLSFNLMYLDQIELGRVRSQLHATLDEATFQGAFSEGWDMSDDQVFALVGDLVATMNLS